MVSVGQEHFLQILTFSSRVHPQQSHVSEATCHDVMGAKHSSHANFVVQQTSRYNLHMMVYCCADEAMRLLVRRRCLQRHAGEQRRLEPAAKLIVTFKVEVTPAAHVCKPTTDVGDDAFKLSCTSALYVVIVSCTLPSSTEAQVDPLSNQMSRTSLHLMNSSAAR